MCGINGIFTFTATGKSSIAHINASLQMLHKRGPDAHQVFHRENMALGHARLSIIDTSSAANQPFIDNTGRYALVFNGEIYNYKILKEKYLSDLDFHTTSDTEVLLYLLIRLGEKCLSELSGFFAFCFYDLQEKKALLARDRYGKKPLVYYIDSNKFIFASEIKAIESFEIPLSINKSIVYEYFKFTYNPTNNFTIYNEIHRLPPGSYAKIDTSSGDLKIFRWYQISKPHLHTQAPDYNDAQSQLAQLLEDSVKERLVTDVPLGAFLSGGLDSSVIVALASKYVDRLKTFSIGFKDNPFFDETYYSDLVAKKYNTDHTKIIIENRVLLDHVHDLLEYIDEPFADSSALALYVLCKESRKHVTVALSGDGADEIFAGYQKYLGEYKIQQATILKQLIHIESIVKLLPASRKGFFSNKIRQVQKLIEGLKLTPHQRYLRFSSINTGEELNNLFRPEFMDLLQMDQLKSIEDELSHIDTDISNVNDILWRDQQMVLPNDMLVKVDLMSMANSLEVRSPFLDHKIGEFANQLPENYKVDGVMNKKIVQDTFRPLLPKELYNRPKKGFDVPMIGWFKNELHSYIFNELLSESFIESQGIFNYSYIQSLKKRLFSNSPNDVQAQLWALVVFQSWYKKKFA